MKAFEFLISFAFDFYLMLVLLRLWLQLAQADFYNPFSQFIVKVTHGPLRFIRRVIPPFRRFDTASLVLAFLVVFLKVLLFSIYQKCVGRRRLASLSAA